MIDDDNKIDNTPIEPMSMKEIFFIIIILVLAGFFFLQMGLGAL